MHHSFVGPKEDKRLFYDLEPFEPLAPHRTSVVETVKSGQKNN